MLEQAFKDFLLLLIYSITRKKMSPTSIGGGGEYHNGRERISPASLKGQEEALSIDKAGTMAL